MKERKWDQEREIQKVREKFFGEGISEGEGEESVREEVR